MFKRGQIYRQIRFAPWTLVTFDNSHFVRFRMRYNTSDRFQSWQRSALVRYFEGKLMYQVREKDEEFLLCQSFTDAIPSTWKRKKKTFKQRKGSFSPSWKGPFLKTVICVFLVIFHVCTESNILAYLYWNGIRFDVHTILVISDWLLSNLHCCPL